MAVLVADHSKSGRLETIAVEPLSALHALVTTREIAADTVDAIRSLGVQVITC
jgi:DeoR/GlpR family transcriptional regulator of sugar metabolism